ncbi:MAG: hypothetical protein L0215_07160 [Gemmataceae bacterium]|nr:hypothetical protein [Gemmataceae bacterium]
MSRLTDPAILARYKQALAEWSVEGTVELVGRVHEGLRTTLEGVTVRGFKEALFRFVCEKDGEIDQVKEEREPWRDQWEWHYDLRPTIDGVLVYVETRLFPESFTSREEPTVYIVQFKPA